MFDIFKMNFIMFNNTFTYLYIIDVCSLISVNEVFSFMGKYFYIAHQQTKNNYILCA